MLAHIAQVAPRVTSRALAGDDDWWEVRRLLVDTYPIAPPYWNWEMRRWDGSRFHNPDGRLSPETSARIRLWETGEGRLVGVVHDDHRGEACLELDPDFRHLEEEMIAWAEEHLAAPVAGHSRSLDFFVWDYDLRRQLLLGARGYHKTSECGVVRHLRLGFQPLPPVIVAPGYTLRTTRPCIEDCERMAYLLNSAFSRSSHTADEYVTFTTLSPSYREELNLVVEAPDGSFASHAGLNYEPVHRRAIFEPVCTHPAHRQKGLAKALMIGGLHRLRQLGAADVFVETGSAVAANALYDSIGFTEAYTGRTWQKTLPV